MGGFELVWDATGDFLRRFASSPLAGISQWILALVFLLSGTGKIRRPSLAAMAIVDFGVARRARRWQGLALGWGETVLGIALATGLVRALMLFAALSMLVVFSFLISNALRSGKTFACFCFGEAAALSTWTLIRTLLLAGVAGLTFAAVLRPESTGTGIAGMEVLELSTTVTVIGCFVLSVHVRNLLVWNSTPAQPQVSN